MHLIDWLIIASYLTWIVVGGLRRSRGSDRLESYFLADRSLSWWAIGLSVMATQLSAITLVGTTGQGYVDGMRFIQFYFGLPVAMIILSVTVVPFFHRARVYTAYEYLEQRFDLRTRMLTSTLFLVSRGLSCGVIIAAPAVILSIVLDWNLTVTILAIGIPTTAYTMIGGIQAVTWADVRQIFVIMVGIGATVLTLVFGFPNDISLEQALHVAGATGRLRTIDFTFDLNETYTFWSGMIGGLFLMLSYFGCDQSQVQRYLTAKSVNDGRHSLLMSGFVKIPLQAMILFTGVLVFVFYLFTPPPMLFNPVHDSQLRTGSKALAYAELEEEFTEVFHHRREAARSAAMMSARGDAEGITETHALFAALDTEMNSVRQKAVSLVKEVTGDQHYNDINYVFPTFVTTQLPIGLVGLIVAAIFAAAMSSISSELNALSTATVIDIYKRRLRSHKNDEHYLLVSKIATGIWGVFACLVASFAVTLGSLIEVVNRFGSFFYGSLLGVFVLAIGVRTSTSRGAFWGLITGMGVVATVALLTNISFLWHNVVGAVTVVCVGFALRKDR